MSRMMGVCLEFRCTFGESFIPFFGRKLAIVTDKFNINVFY